MSTPPPSLLPLAVKAVVDTPRLATAGPLPLLPLLPLLLPLLLLPPLVLLPLVLVRLAAALSAALVDRASSRCRRRYWLLVVKSLSVEVIVTTLG